MITRLWWGWTEPADADAYQELLQTEVLPEVGSHEGYRGSEVLRRQAGDEIEFCVVTRWESMEAVRGFAGDDPEAAVVPPAARELLSRFDDRSRHYETVHRHVRV